MFETDNGRMTFDDLMTFVEGVRKSDLMGIGDGDAPDRLFSPRINSAYTAMHDPVLYDRTHRFGETIEKFRRGRISEVWFREAISTSDYSQLTQNLLMWNMLAAYIQAPNVWEQMVRINSTVPDFRNVQVTHMEGLDGPMPAVRELGNYQQDAPSTWDRQYHVAKYGRIFRMSWEARMNDWLRMFDMVPQALANGARSTENSLVTSVFASAAGPNPLLFSTDGSTNGWTTNGVATPGVINETVGASANLTVDNLVAIYIKFVTRQMLNGNPQSLQPRYLLVPAALRYEAEKLLESPNLIASNITTAGTTPGFVSNLNIAPKLGLTVVENRWLNNVDVSANVNKTWYLVGDPAYGAAVEAAFLLGHRNPELFRQAPNQLSIGGGGVASPDDGDFEQDAMGWKIRHVMGVTPLDPRFAWAAVGA